MADSSLQPGQIGVLYSKLRLCNPKIKLDSLEWKTSPINQSTFLVSVDNLQAFYQLESGNVNFESKLILAKPSDPPVKIYYFVYEFPLEKARINELEFICNLELNSSFVCKQKLEDVDRLEDPEYESEVGMYCFIRPGFLKNVFKLPHSELYLKLFNYKPSVFSAVGKVYVRIDTLDGLIKILTILQKRYDKNFFCRDNLVAIYGIEKPKEFLKQINLNNKCNFITEKIKQFSL